MPQTTGPAFTVAWMARLDGSIHTVDQIDDEIRDMKIQIRDLWDVAHFRPDAAAPDGGLRAGQIKPGWAPIYIGTTASLGVADSFPEILVWDPADGQFWLSYDDGGGYDWTAVSPSRPSGWELVSLAESDYEQRISLANNWEEITTNGADALEASVSIPATPTYAEWAIDAEWNIYITDTAGDNQPAVRAVHDYDGGASVTYPKVVGFNLHGNAPNLFTMRHRITGIADGVAGKDLGKIYDFRAEFGTQSGTNSYVNRVGGAGPGGGYDPLSSIFVRAYRVDA